jgi:hypothetical protein
MQRLKLAKRQLRSFMHDIMVQHGAKPPYNEVVALAKIKEALALIEEADFCMGKVRQHERK